LSLVVREGDPVPGAEPGVVFDALNIFFSVGASGHLVFAATLAGPSIDSSNFQSIFLVDPEGTLHLVARSGTLFDVNGDGTDMRIVSSLLPGNVSPGGFVPFELRFTDGSSGIFTAHFEPVTGVAAGSPGERHRLGNSFPNPLVSGRSVSIPLRLASETRVRLRLHDVQGRLVATLADRSFQAGDHTVRWDGNSARGSRVANGIYYVDFTAGRQHESARIVVAR
jgi:flagellar hook capping protein FlgD